MRYRILLTFSMVVLFSELLLAEVVEKSLQVVVTDKGTSAPLPYATVCWQSIAAKQKGTTQTNIAGVATIKAPVGRLAIAVSSVGYKPFRDTVEVSSIMEIALAEDIFNLEQVTVTGTRTPRSLKETPVLTQLVTRKDIRITSAVTLKDVLEFEIPSIEMGQHGGAATLKTQGLDGKYTLVLIDGERMAGETDGNVDFSRISAANIEQVEIVRGASSALYGSNALGSVINIITKKPSKKFDVAVDMRYAEPNQRNNTAAAVAAYEDSYVRTFLRNQDRQNLNGNISLGFKTDHLYSNTFFGYKSEDSYRLFDTKGQKRYYPLQDSLVHEGITPNPTEISGFQDYSIANKTGYAGASWNAEVRGSYYNHEEFDFSRNKKHDRYSDYTLGGFGEKKIGTRSTLRFSFNHDVYGKYDRYETIGTDTLNYEDGFDNAKLIFNGRYRSQHTLLASVEFQHEYLKSVMFVENKLAFHDISDAVVVLQDEFSVRDGLDIVASLRSGYNSVYGEHYTPSITIHSVHGFWNYRLTYGQGFRSPMLKELYSNWPHLTLFTIIGSKDLKPETSNFYSFSTDYVNTNRKLNATLVASYSHVSNKIDGYWSANQKEYHYANIDEWKVFSAEFLTRWRPIGSLQLKAGYVYTKVFESSERVKKAAISPHSITAQVEYSVKKGKYEMVANLSGKVIGAKNVSELDPLNNQFYDTSYPTYSLWNLTLNHRFGEHFGVTTGVKNLFNYRAPIVTFSTTTTVGRRFYVSVAYNF